MPKKQKKPKKPRLKVEKGLGKIMEWIQKQNAKDVVEGGLYASLAYLSYDKLTTRDDKGNVTRHIQNTLWGPIALRLALTPGGIGSPSQIAGLAGLAVLGLAIGADDFGGYQTPVGPNKDLIITFGESCPNGYYQIASNFGFNYCMRVKE